MSLEKRARELKAEGVGYREIGRRLREDGHEISDWEARKLTGTSLGKERSPEPEADPLDSLLGLLLKRGRSGISHQELGDFSDGILGQLEASGYTLSIKGGRIVLDREPETRIRETPIEGIFDPRRKFWEFAVISDSHLGGFQAQPGFIRAIFQEAEKRGCSAVLHAGDHVDGSPKMHAGFIHELGLHSVDEQVDYVAELYSELQIPLLALGGNHDGSWFKDCGIDIIRLISDRSDNVINMGPIQAWVAGPNGDPNFIRLFHPGDGCSYALSYKDQKTAEFLTLQNDKVPTGFHFTGHYHKMNHMRGPNGARYFLVPSSCGTTSFMKAKRLVNTAGAYFIRFSLDAQGRVDRCIVEDIILPPDQWTKADYAKRPKVSKVSVNPSTVWGG